MDTDKNLAIAIGRDLFAQLTQLLPPIEHMLTEGAEDSSHTITLKVSLARVDGEYRASVTSTSKVQGQMTPALKLGVKAVSPGVRQLVLFEGPPA